MNSELRITGVNPNPQNPRRGAFNNPDDSEDTNQESGLLEEVQEDSFVLSKNAKRKRQKPNLKQGSKNESNLVEKLKKLISGLMGFSEIVDKKETENA